MPTVKFCKRNQLEVDQIVGIDSARIKYHMSKFRLCTNVNEFILQVLSITLKGYERCEIIHCKVLSKIEIVRTVV